MWVTELKLRSRIQRVIIVAGILLTFLACQWDRKTEPSVLVLAVESLPFESVSCVDSEDGLPQESGFQVLCRESVRFSHTFTPSPLSQPALASLMTGLWPFEHGVRDNGATALSSRFTTIAEVAHDKSYRTAFFSGGAPIFRKSGISQGFEIFDDAVLLRPDRLVRPFSETNRQFRQWHKSEVGNNRKFLSVIYIPDLQIFDEPTLDEKGRINEKSYQGRLRRLQSSLLDLFEYLKKEGAWDSTYIFLVGLNGYSDLERFNELPSTNLHVENTQVSLLVKPPQKKRDLGLTWKIDANVTLLDIGKTIFELLDFDPFPNKGGSYFPAYSLVRALHAAEPDWPNDRLIPIESSWAKWKGIGETRFGLRSGPHLYLHDQKPKLFNTLTDRLELSPIGRSASNTLEWEEKINRAREYFGLQNWEGLPQQILHQVDVAINIWDPSGRSGVIQQENEAESNIAGWLAIRAIEARNWTGLARLARFHKNRFWEALASSNLEGKSSYPENTCLKWATKVQFDVSEGKDCGDPIFKNLIGWIKSDENNKESIAFRETFIRNYKNLMLDRRIAQLNYVNGLCWDVSPVFTQGPVLSEIYLNYPENRKFWVVLQERLKTDTYDGEAM